MATLIIEQAPVIKPLSRDTHKGTNRILLKTRQLKSKKNIYLFFNAGLS